MKDEYGDTPLTYACIDGDIELVKKLIDLGADVNTTNYSLKYQTNDSALMLAALHGRSEICNLLIRNGANLHYDAKYDDVNYYTALWSAYASKDPTTILIIKNHLLNRFKLAICCLQNKFSLFSLPNDWFKNLYYFYMMEPK